MSPKQQSHVLRILFYFLAITGCFCVYSIIQERLMTIGFGPEKELFKYSVFVVFINRIVTVTVAASVLLWLGSPIEPAAPVALFGIPAAANVIGSTAQYEALKYVSFPLQALAKCAKTVSLTDAEILFYSNSHQTRSIYQTTTFPTLKNLLKTCRFL